MAVGPMAVGPMAVGLIAVGLIAYRGTVSGDERSDTVIGKVGILLGAFGFDDPELGLSELARRTGLAKTTVYRLALDLVAVGFMERAGARFRLGSRLFELGQRVPRHRTLRDAALPFMEDLFVATRETIHLGVLNDDEVLYVEKLAGRQAVSAPSRVAGRMPLHCTATGKAILAHCRADIRARVLAHGLERLTPFTIADPRVLATELRRIRAKGVAVEIEETRVGYASVAAPVFGPGDEVVGALSVTGPTSRVDPVALAPAVRTATRGLGRVLRADPTDGAVTSERPPARRAVG